MMTRLRNQADHCLTMDRVTGPTPALRDRFDLFHVMGL